MNTITPPGMDRATEDKHRALWGLGDYGVIAGVVEPLGERLVRAAGVGAHDRVLDVAAGTGNAAIAAARTGAAVVATDLVPALLEQGRHRAATVGVDLGWQVANAEELPFGDGEFDIVLSCIGAMFAPHHQRTADELLRVCRPGGTVAMLNWTPEGFVGRLFATMRPFVPAPPAGASPPPRWGAEEHVRALLGDRAADIAVRREVLHVDCFADGVTFRDCFKTYYGPTIAAYRAIGTDPARVDALDCALAELGQRALDSTGGMDWEYLVVRARRR
ncbi:class I SAM-dependent methyltransferase [Mycolicibacterium palauense]|uniref:class I SAM-dependent methyltransferase n=1 Tax=Mycolicibacterium palauense TaxID=2034511 RepID=UPI000BFEAACD|nr:class I SAM-dependent methyltransferase [Mycolicibacterium palauense]